MLSRFYKKTSGALLWLVMLSFPFLYWKAQSTPSNNDIETWLPKGSEVRATYEQFKQDFGVEELILVAVEERAADEKLVEALCGRLDRLPGVRRCWSPERLRGVMHEHGVNEAQSIQRLRGLSLSEDGHLIGLVVLLSDAGLKDRSGTVKDISRQLEYCQLRGNEVCVAGAPVVVAELDRLGGQEESRKFFLITLLICLALLHYWIRDWKLTFAVMGLTIWAIHLTLALFCLFGGEMNFILGALSVMVTVFTLEAAIHVLHYHKASLASSDAVGEALRLSWKPCGMSMLTTVIGLYSVSVSDILPVTQFGYAAALGALVSMATGLLLTPAILTVLPSVGVRKAEHESHRLARIGTWLLARYRGVIACTIVVGLVASAGLLRIQTKIDPLDFLPKQSKVLCDVRRVERELTNLNSIEAVVDFDNQKLPFVERLQVVRELESRIRRHPAVRHTMSLSAFFPDPLPDNPMELMSILQKAQSRRDKNEYLARGERLWRISARISPQQANSYNEVYRELADLAHDPRIHFTGIAPLLEKAQHEIFDGFWKSFSSAFFVILVVMVLSLRSIKIAAIAMIPNLAPIAIVFGFLGWAGIPVDIGMMMTGSIALGITVDGTYHLLARYQEQCARGKRRKHAVRIALLSTGGPIFESIIVSSLGMLALAFSSFSPTARFGCMMASLLIAALGGGLVLLPALLCLEPRRTTVQVAKTAPVPVSHSRQIRRLTRLPADRVA